MRFLKIILALYLIVVAGITVIGAVYSIGKTLPPVTVIEALVGILLIVPLFILGFIVIRYNGGSTNKEYEKKLESLITKVEKVADRLEGEPNNKSEEF